ncbi:hypothetical protein Pla163_13860 [Planctomycetes bacterium Pla163]|uniref:Uncharacterized protein n=1 Tax=Rohdeia mirabilis TaxID=2528008 RepID=A0A518CYH3_9BACT|nr:hypothetical protein Pla163_13860 [Planctomycetes bacterium Pla163]
MTDESARRWRIESATLGGTDTLILRFASTRARVLHGRVTFVPLSDEDGAESEGAVRAGTVTTTLSILDGVAFARTPTAIVSGTYEIEIDAVSSDGAAILGAVVLLAPVVGVRQPIVRRLPAVAVPDWIVDRDGFRERFGPVGARRFEAFAVPVYEIEAAVDLGAEVIAASLTSILDGLLLVNEDAARVKALEVACAAGRYFAEVDMRSSKPFVPGDLPEGVVSNGRDKLEDRINERAVYGVAGQSWKAVEPSGPTMIGLLKFCDRTTEVFAQAEKSHLVDPGDGVDAFEWAYELFVSGRLAVAHPHEFVHRVVMARGAPDGTPFLLFAELASLCLDLGTDDTFWMPRFEHLVRAAILFHAHPATDAAVVQELGHPEADPMDLYAFYDGKHIAMRTVFELRRTHGEVLDALAPDERRKLLEDAFTWIAGKIVGASGGSPTGTGVPLVLEPKLFLPGQLAAS